MSAAHLDETFFRREYACLVAALARRIGVHHIAAIEDAAQAALVSAVESWSRNGLPDSPSAWLFRVAHNEVVGQLRQHARRQRIATAWAVELSQEAVDAPSATLAGDVGDDLVRMLFACCDASIPAEAQLVLALKTLCGFEVREIALRLFITEANVYKRLARARERLRATTFETSEFSAEQLRTRLPTVQTIVYTLFTEGYLSAQADDVIRRELCDEALRLAELLAEHPSTSTPETFALLALIHLHIARMPARQDAAGGLLLLEEQDRSHWDQRQIQQGMIWLAKSAEGDVFSRYHAEAGIAAEHCLAASFAQTRWDKIVENYVLLARHAPSAVHTLNAAVATAELRGAAEGLAVIEGLEPPSWLAGSYMWSAVLSDLHRRCGHDSLARSYRAAALASAPSTAVKEALQRRLRSDEAEST